MPAARRGSAKWRNDQLLRTGVALGGRNLETMGPAARNNLSHFTDAEIAALYSYLHAMPEAAKK